MRLTIEQRLGALERDSVVLHDTIKLLHKLLKEQRGLINDYIVQTIGQSNNGGDNDGENGRAEDAIYTFVCQQRFKQLERDIQRIFKRIEDTCPGRRAG